MAISSRSRFFEAGSVGQQVDIGFVTTKPLVPTHKKTFVPPSVQFFNEEEINRFDS
jgi:hypothetical protein